MSEENYGELARRKAAALWRSTYIRCLGMLCDAARRGTGSTGCVLVGDTCRAGDSLGKSSELLLEKPVVLLTFKQGFSPAFY